MPYKSAAQRGFFHAALDRGEIDKSLVDKFDKESKGQTNLPEHVKQPRRSLAEKLVKNNKKTQNNA